MPGRSTVRDLHGRHGGSRISRPCGYVLQDAIFKHVSPLGTVGLSMGVTSAAMPVVALWLETFAMFLGRFESLGVFVSLFKIVGDYLRLAARTMGG